ncbi:hypothetical protein IJV79_01305 [bacterium]|nr:hypothetical protein [bacterium]
MINPAIMQLKIEKSNITQELKQQELKIKRLFFELQTLANPYYTNISEIKACEIEQCAKEMVNTKEDLLNLEQRLGNIKEQLGE